MCQKLLDALASGIFWGRSLVMIGHMGRDGNSSKAKGCSVWLPENRKYHETSVCVHACQLMIPAGFVKKYWSSCQGTNANMEGDCLAIRKAGESSGWLLGESGSNYLSLFPMGCVDLSTEHMAPLQRLLALSGPLPASHVGCSFPHLCSEHLL